MCARDSESTRSSYERLIDRRSKLIFNLTSTHTWSSRTLEAISSDKIQIMSHSNSNENQQIVDDEGQFEDAPEDNATPALGEAPAVDPRAGHRFIDEEEVLKWSSDEDEEDPEYDEFDVEEDVLEATAFQTLRPEDEDWEIAEGGKSNRFHFHIERR